MNPMYMTDFILEKQRQIFYLSPGYITRRFDSFSLAGELQAGNLNSYEFLSNISHR